MKIAVSGKGGVGKTTFSTNLIYRLQKDGYNVFAVDADPDLSLGTLLGVPEDQIANLKPIVEMRDLISDRTNGDGSLYVLNPEVDDVLDDFSIDINGVKFLKMGSTKQGGSSCYCLENTFLNSVMNALVLKRKEAVLLDMGAGIEHLTRGTARGVNCLIIITEPTIVSSDTAKVTTKLAHDIGVEKVFYVGNKIRRESEKEFLQKVLPKENILGFLSYNDSVLDKAMGLDVSNNEDMSKFDNELELIYQNLIVSLG